MQLTLTPDQASSSCTPWSNVTSTTVWSDSGKDESIRLALDDEQDMLVEIQSRLHELSREVRSAR